MMKINNELDVNSKGLLWLIIIIVLILKNGNENVMELNELDSFGWNVLW